MKIRTMPIGRGPTEIPEGWRLYSVIPGYERDVPTAVIVQDEDDDDYPVCGVCKDRHRPGQYAEDPSLSAHICTITPEPGGFLVSCPHGCGLGDSAHAPSVTAAERRGELHRMATEPLITETRR